MKFTELGLVEPIVRAVSAKGYTEPSPIQAAAIPAALEGFDILGCAQTGTGKTCAFALPILHDLHERSPGKLRKGRLPRALVLAPTRELATQIFESFVAYGKNLKLRHAVVYGGVKQGKQVAAMRNGVDVLVATPGRLLDLVNQGHVDLSEVETLVLDEADRMLDMGFIHDIRKVVGMISDERQTLFFSATVSKEIRALTDTILVEPVTIEMARESTTAEAIAQRVYLVERENKAELLGRLIGGEDVERALVFSKTKYGADKLVKVLSKVGIGAESIHGDKSQHARTKAMKRFKTGKTHVMVATDIAARGIDVDNITHVVNFDMPIDPETYVHRIGRTARAGASGIAISMCSREEVGKLKSVQRRTKVEIEVGEDHDDLTFPMPVSKPRLKKGKGGNPGSKRHSRRKFDRDGFGEREENRGKRVGGGKSAKRKARQGGEKDGRGEVEIRVGKKKEKSSFGKPGCKPGGKLGGKPGGKSHGKAAGKGGKGKFAKASGGEGGRAVKKSGKRVISKKAKSGGKKGGAVMSSGGHKRVKKGAVPGRKG